MIPATSHTSSRDPQAMLDSRCPLGMAAAEGHAAVVALLVQLKADVNPPPDDWGDTPYSIAQKKGLGSSETSLKSLANHFRLQMNKDKRIDRV